MRLPVRDPRVRLPVLAPDRAVHVDQHADVLARRLVDRAQHARPAVRVRLRDALECRARHEGGAERPVPDGQAHGVDPDAREVLEVRRGDERVPVALEHGLRARDGPPSTRDVELGRLRARSAFKQGRRHPVLVHKPAHCRVTTRRS